MNAPAQTSAAASRPLQQFEASLKTDDVVAALADGLIGKDAVVDGPYGAKPLVYADYVA
jgi:hypothetical protein